MTGREFVVELERQGFAIKRRCRTFVWIARGEQTLMLDEEAIVPDDFLARVLATHAHTHSRPPPSGRVPTSQTMRRASMRPSRPSGRLPKNHSSKP